MLIDLLYRRLISNLKIKTQNKKGDWLYKPITFRCFDICYYCFAFISSQIAAYLYCR